MGGAMWGIEHHHECNILFPGQRDSMEHRPMECMVYHGYRRFGSKKEGRSLGLVEKPKEPEYRVTFRK